MHTSAKVPRLFVKKTSWKSKVESERTHVRYPRTTDPEVYICCRQTCGNWPEAWVTQSGMCISKRPLTSEAVFYNPYSTHLARWQVVKGLWVRPTTLHGRPVPGLGFRVWSENPGQARLHKGPKLHEDLTKRGQVNNSDNLRSKLQNKSQTLRKPWIRPWYC